MKKEYTTPTMKVWEMNPDSMLCLSGEVNFGNSFNSGYNDYIDGDSGSGFTTGIPD